MDKPTSKYTFDKFVRIIFTTAILICLYFLLKYLSPVLIPFVVALLLAYLINPVIVFFEKHVKSRVLAVWITIFLLLLITLFAILVIIPQISKELTQTYTFVNNLLENQAILDHKDSKYNLISFFWTKVQNFLQRDEIKIITKVESFKVLLNELSKSVFPTVISIFNGALSLVGFILSLCLVLLYLTFMMFGFNQLKYEWQTLIPENYRQKVLDFIRTFNTSMNNYFRGQTLVALCVGILFSIGFIILKLPMALILGIFFGILNIIPYMQVFGYLPAVILSILKSINTGMPIWKSIALTFLSIIIVQIIQDTILVPRIVRKTTGLHPVMIILSLSVWGRLFGFLGFLIAIPFTCLLLEYYNKIINKKSSIESR